MLCPGPPDFRRGAERTGRLGLAVRPRPPPLKVPRGDRSGGGRGLDDAYGFAVEQHFVDEVVGDPGVLARGEAVGERQGEVGVAERGAGVAPRPDRLPGRLGQWGKVAAADGWIADRIWAARLAVGPLPA